MWGKGTNCREYFPRNFLLGITWNDIYPFRGNELIVIITISVCIYNYTINKI